MGKAPRYTKRPSASGTLVKLLAAAAGVSVLVLIIIVILVVRSAGSKEAPEETIPSEPTVQTATASGTEPSATTEVERVTTEPTEQAAEQTAEPTEETTAETTVPETTRPKVTGSTGQNTSVSPTKPTASGGTHTPDDGHTHGNYYDIPHLKANCTNPGTVYSQCGYCKYGRGNSRPGKLSATGPRLLRQYRRAANNDHPGLYRIYLQTLRGQLRQ